MWSKFVKKVVKKYLAASCKFAFEQNISQKCAVKTNF